MLGRIFRVLSGFVLACLAAGLSKVLFAYSPAEMMNLPPEIAINWAMEVEPSFHARYTAQGRSYRYCILRRATRPALLRHQVCWTRAALDAGHAKGKVIRKETALAGVGIPLHPGAERFYKEAGLVK